MKAFKNKNSLRTIEARPKFTGSYFKKCVYGFDQYYASPNTTFCIRLKVLYGKTLFEQNIGRLLSLKTLK